MKQVILFTAPWCFPCKQFKPIFNEVTSELNVDTTMVNYDSDDETIMAMFNDAVVQSIPTTIVKDENGNEVARKVGSMHKEEFTQWLTEVLK